METNIDIYDIITIKKLQYLQENLITDSIVIITNEKATS
jgi:hypothetical protein